MSISTTYLDFSLQANHKKREYTLSLELRLIEAIKDIFYILFSTPRLKQQIGPGKFKDLDTINPPATMQCWR